MSSGFSIKGEFEYIKNLISSKNFGEFFDKITWSFIGKIVFLAFIAFMVSPLTQLVKNSISFARYGVGSDYNAYVILPARSTALLFGAIAIILAVGKNIRCKYGIRSFFADNTPMRFFIPLTFLMLISTCINGYTWNAFGSDYFNETPFSYFFYFLICYFGASMIDSGKIKAVLEYAFIIAGTIIAFVFMYHVYIDQLAVMVNIHGPEDLGAVFYTHNHYAYYLTLLILTSGSLFVLEKNKILRVLCMISFIINTAALIINTTRGCFFACALALIFFIIIRYICTKKISKGGIAIFVIFWIVTLIVNLFTSTFFQDIIGLFFDIGNIIKEPKSADAAGNYRWAIWKFVASYITEKPIFGFGVEGIASRLDKATGNNGISRPHNEFLLYAVYFGIPASILYFCGNLAVFLKGLKNKLTLDIHTTAAIVASFGYLVSACFGNSTFYLSPIFFIFLGLAMSGKRHA